MKILTAVLLILTSAMAWAGPGSLAFAIDPPVVQDVPPVTNYRVYLGAASGNYTITIDVGTATITNYKGAAAMVFDVTARVLDGAIPAGIVVFAAMTAINEAGLESNYSNEIVFSIPRKPVLKDAGKP